MGQLSRSNTRPEFSDKQKQQSREWGLEYGRKGDPTDWKLTNMVFFNAWLDGMLERVRKIN